MWPFKPRKSFAEDVLIAFSQVAERVRLQVMEARSNGLLTRGEYMALVFPGGVALKLAKIFLVEPGAPLHGLRKSDAPALPLWPLGGYIVLLNFMLYVLRKIMENQPDVANNIGTTHPDLIRKYAEITEFQEEMFISGINSNAELGGDTELLWDKVITDFLQTMTKQPLTPTPTELYVTMLHATVTGGTQQFSEMVLQESNLR